MKLNKALKVKNRLVGELSKNMEILKRENSRRNDNPSKVDCKAVETEMLNLFSKVILIKTAIAKANVPIYGSIAKIAELKTLINYYNGLPTREGEEVVLVGRDTGTLKYQHTAYLNREAIDKLVAGYQKQINELQDEVDAHNSSVNVDFAD